LRWKATTGFPILIVFVLVSLILIDSVARAIVFKRENTSDDLGVRRHDAAESGVGADYESTRPNPPVAQSRTGSLPVISGRAQAGSLCYFTHAS